MANKITINPALAVLVVVVAIFLAYRFGVNNSNEIRQAENSVELEACLEKAKVKVSDMSKQSCTTMGTNARLDDQGQIIDCIVPEYVNEQLRETYELLTDTCFKQYSK